MYPSPCLRNRILVNLFGGEVKQVEPVKVDQLLGDGDSPAFAPDLSAIHVPGHCAGQIAFLWRRHGGVLFTADACINSRGLRVAIATEEKREAHRALATDRAPAARAAVR